MSFKEYWDAIRARNGWEETSFFTMKIDTVRLRALLQQAFEKGEEHGRDNAKDYRGDFSDIGF